MKRGLSKFPGLVVGLLILALSLSFTFVAFKTVERSESQQLNRRFQRVAGDMAHDILDRLSVIEENLHASRAFVLASKKLDREAWLNFQDHQRMAVFHPATLGIGLAPEVARADLDAYLNKIRREEQSDYEIWPSGSRAVYAPIRFKASHNADSRAPGLDMYFEPKRRAAMERARDTGKASLSGAVILLRAGRMESQESIIMFLPVYKYDLAPDASLEARRQAFASYVYCPIGITKFWQDLTAKAAQKHVSIDIRDSYGGNILSTYPHVSPPYPELVSDMTREVYGQVWTIHQQAMPEFVSTETERSAAIVGTTGIVISVLLFSIFWLITSTKLRAEAIALRKTRSLRESENRYRALWETSKKATEALRESEEKYRQIVELIPEMVTIHQNEIFVFANSASARLLGVADSSELVGRSVFEFLHPDIHDTVRPRVKRLYEGDEQVAPAELKMIRADGAVVYFEIHAAPAVWKGRPAAQVFARDVTQRRQAEEDRRKAESELRNYAERLQTTSRRLLEVQENERRILARELHDSVGQELTALGLNLTILNSAIPAELADKIAGRLHDSQKLLEDTTQNLRNVMVELRPVGIEELGLIAVLKDHAMRVAHRSDLEVRVSGEEPNPGFTITIAIALFRIVQEALNNTVKHARAATAVITLHETSEVTTLTVTDDGDGFDHTLKPPIGIYGMGMTTMRERAEAIGARLSIQSEIGHGTCIVVELPADGSQINQDHS
jgi:PAS domain S-box-containing protein